MRYFMTAFATLSLGAFPLTAQVPVRPTPPTAPARTAGPPAQITEEQRQEHLAIREKYAKEIQAQREGVQALNEKMRAEIEATLTPEQRQAVQQRGGRGLGLGQGGGRGLGLQQGGGRGMGLGQGGQGGGRGFGQGQGGGRQGAMAGGRQLRQHAMLWNRADRAAQQVIMMRDRMAGREMRQQRGTGQLAQPGIRGGRRGGMIGQGNMMGGPPAVKPAPGKAPPPPPAPVKKPTTGGGE